MTVAATTATANVPTNFSSAAPAASTVEATTTTSSNALSTLSNNFNDFLNLLMTQLKNQDPSSPMDSNQFTSELVQFSSVEQQIKTNASLDQLIKATQGTNLLQSSSLVGQTVQLSGSQATLQNGQTTINYTGQAGQPVSIGVYGKSGTLLASTSVTSSTAAGSWTWNGKASNGAQQPDGAYNVVVQDANGKAVLFTSQGNVTGVQRTGEAVNVSLGGLSVDLSSVESVAGRSSSSE